MDGRQNNGGSRPGAGAPGYGKMKAIREYVEKFTPLWFENLSAFMEGSDKNDRKYAMTELGKLMGKMIPTQVESDSALFKLVIERSDDRGEEDQTTQVPG